MLINVRVLEDDVYGTSYNAGDVIKVDAEKGRTTDGKNMNIPVIVNNLGKPELLISWVESFEILGLAEDEEPTSPSLTVQVGGEHYTGMCIQPVEYIHKNGIDYLEGNVIKYVSRWKNKNGIEDLKKARHYLDLLIEFEDI